MWMVGSTSGAEGPGVLVARSSAVTDACLHLLPGSRVQLVMFTPHLGEGEAPGEGDATW